ncbi:MAG TPA: polyhydroxyalkanoate synthesis regulator DNA-binding domain-containing protein [Candidatus Solibacter sp.]|nr:polyhydroxyalkanoate synthesis regulator DNA-binding domain-containing protein [Candidatus Solibacter sp.]
MPRKSVIIKKYGNRRLYDSTNSRYINQAEVARLIRQGLDVKVLDAATGEDVTRLVLTQIIVEDAKEPDSNFPLDILRQLIVTSGKATQEGTLKYMKSVLDMYQNAFRAITKPLNPFEFIQPPSTAPAAPATSQRPSSPPDSAEAASGSSQELQQRVEELEALVAKMAAGSRRARPKPKSRRKH